MQGPRASKKAEYESVLTLINQVFRINNNFAPTMSTEYPLLLCYENMDNMRIILEDDQPVSTVSYCTTNMIIEGATLKAASVGSVCTHPGYRGRNYATQLMDDVEARMKDNGVEVMLVSGDRDLYLRRGCVTVGGFYKAQLESKQIGIQDYVSLVDISKDLLGQLIFGQRGQDGIVDSLFQNELANKPKIKSVLSTVFPIPFPLTANMNYI